MATKMFFFLQPYSHWLIQTKAVYNDLLYEHNTRTHDYKINFKAEVKISTKLMDSFMFIFWNFYKRQRHDAGINPRSYRANMEQRNGNAFFPGLQPNTWLLRYFSPPASSVNDQEKKYMKAFSFLQVSVRTPCRSAVGPSTFFRNTAKIWDINLVSKLHRLLSDRTWWHLWEEIPSTETPTTQHRCMEE